MFLCKRQPISFPSVQIPVTQYSTAQSSLAAVHRSGCFLLPPCDMAETSKSISDAREAAPLRHMFLFPLAEGTFPSPLFPRSNRDAREQVSAMNSSSLAVLLLAAFSLYSAGASPHRAPNVTVLGSVYCDACSSHNFSKDSYFLRGAQVMVVCKFVASLAAREEMSITAYRTTDRFGVYRLDVPPVDGFECREGRELKSMCQARLTRSSSSRCNVAGSRTSTAHVAVKDKATGACYYNLNALTFRPARRNALRCGEEEKEKPPSAAAAASGGEVGLDASLMFWPILPPLGIPWPFPFPFPPWPFLLPPSIPFPFPHIPWPDPSSLPFPIPSWLIPFLKPPFFPFPFLSPSPPASSSNAAALTSIP